MKSHLKFAVKISHLLDNQFRIGPVKFGIDPIIGLIPGMGDVIGAIFSAYLIWIARKLKVPQKEIYRMVKHIAIDLIVGIIPFVGEVGDFFYKSNAKNLKILNKYSHLKIEDAQVVD